MIVYSNDYVEDERLFSTGDSELDDILEEVYYSGIEDGYDYAQKEFAQAQNLAKVAWQRVGGAPIPKSAAAGMPWVQKVKSKPIPPKPVPNLGIKQAKNSIIGKTNGGRYVTMDQTAFNNFPKRVRKSLQAQTIPGGKVKVLTTEYNEGVLRRFSEL